MNNGGAATAARKSFFPYMPAHHACVVLTYVVEVVPAALLRLCVCVCGVWPLLLLCSTGRRYPPAPNKKHPHPLICVYCCSGVCNMFSVSKYQMLRIGVCDLLLLFVLSRGGNTFPAPKQRTPAPPLVCLPATAAAGTQKLREGCVDEVRSFLYLCVCGDSV